MADDRWDLIGLHTTSPENTCRWLVIDIDHHGESDPDAEYRNEDAAIAIRDKLENQGVISLLMSSNGRGGFHLWVIFDAPIDTATVYQLGQWIVEDWQELGREVLGDPCLIDGFDGRLHLFVRGTSRRIFRKIRANGTWTAEWENLGGEAIDSPTALAIPGQINSDPEIHLFCTGTTRRAFRKRWTGSKWVEGQLGWENLGAELDCSY